MFQRIVCVAAVVAGLSGCSACDPEDMPHHGVALTTDALLDVVRYAAQEGCDGALYDQLSARTRTKYSFFEIWLALRGMEIPAPWNYDPLDVVAGGEYLGALPADDPGREMALITYQEPGRPELLAQFLVVDELDEDGRVVKRLGVQEQIDEQIPINQAPPPDQVHDE